MVVVFKYMNLCGIGQVDDIEIVWDYVYEVDLVLIFGGIVVFNCEVDVVIVEKMYFIFLEIIIVLLYLEEVLVIFINKKKNLCIFELLFDV